MMNHPLTTSVVTKRLAPDSTAPTTWTLAGGTDDKFTLGVDTAGYGGLRFIVAWGAIAGSAVTSVKAQGSTDDGSSDTYADLADTHVTVADTDDNKGSIVDVFGPLQRYTRLYFDRGTSNAAVDCLWVELYHPGDAPVTQDATIQGTSITAHPLEGTA